jgi:hypothetical protein
MAFVIITTIIVLGTVLFNFVTPRWFTPLASNWGSLDHTIENKGRDKNEGNPSHPKCDNNCLVKAAPIGG